MCLITFNWLNHPEYRLLLVANRDEFFERPSSSLHLWEEGFYAGRDLRGGGTWMGVHPNGRFAALTNYRDLSRLHENPITRGNLVKGFLENDETPLAYLSHIRETRDQYDGFNLLVADGAKMAYFGNYGHGIEEVQPGIHGISNALLDTPWPKVEKAKAALTALIEDGNISPDALVGLLQSESYAPDHLLPKTGVPLEVERQLSAQRIRMGDEYGTVNTTAVLWKHNGDIVVKEKRHDQPDVTEKNFRMGK